MPMVSPVLDMVMTIMQYLLFCSDIIISAGHGNSLNTLLIAWTVTKKINGDSQI